MGNVDDDGRGPVTANEPPDDSPNAARDSVHIHVDPGGGTDTDRTERAARESESGAIVEEIGRIRQHAQNKAERLTTRRDNSIEGERTSALAHGRSTRCKKRSAHLNDR